MMVLFCGSIRWLYVQVVESEEFLLLPVNQLVDIISSDELNVRTEEQVFQAVMAWVKYNIGDRRGHLPSVSIHPCPAVLDNPPRNILQETTTLFVQDLTL